MPLNLHGNHRLILTVALAALWPASIAAQPGGHQGGSVADYGGPLSEISRPVREGSRPVHERGRTLRESSRGSMVSKPVRDRPGRSMLSGPVSEVSSGPVTAGRPMTGSGSIGMASAGAVKKDLDRPLGERISQPLRELQPLRERLRFVREQSLAAAATGRHHATQLDLDGGPHDAFADFEVDYLDDGIDDGLDPFIAEQPPDEPD